MNDMPTKTPTGVELAIHGLIRLLGIKPEMVLQPLAEIRDKVVGFDARQARLEAIIAQQAAALETIKTELEQLRHGTGTAASINAGATPAETGQPQ